MPSEAQYNFTALGFGIVRRCILCVHRSNAAEWIFGCTLAGLAVGFILHQNSFISTASFDAIGLWSAFLMAAPLSIWLAPQQTWLGALNVIIVAAGIVAATIYVPAASTAEKPAWGVHQLTLGWSADDAALRNQLRSVLRPTARLLWERQPGDRFTPSMIPLDFGIPVLSGRDLQNDDQTWGFVRGVLGGRSIADWTDDDLTRFCERWNIGWIRTVSPVSQARIEQWSKAKAWDAVAPGSMTMFSIERPQSYFLRGFGTVESAGPNQIVLSDVKPEGGEVVLSFTWHPGWTSAPSHVAIEPETNAFEPVPLIRLKLQIPINRLVLRWTGR